MAFSPEDDVDELAIVCRNDGWNNAPAIAEYTLFDAADNGGENMGVEPGANDGVALRNCGLFGNAESGGCDGVGIERRFVDENGVIGGPIGIIADGSDSAGYAEEGPDVRKSIELASSVGL